MASFDPTFQSMRTARAVEAGVSRKELRGPGFVHPHHGIARPSSAAGDPLLLRISDAVGLMTPDCVLGGWASLRVQGNTWFSGIGRGDSDRDVLIHCGVGSQLRVRAGIRPSEGVIFADEVESMENFSVTAMARAAYDEMRMAWGLRDAVAVLDMAISSSIELPHTTLSRVMGVVDSHHKTRGIVQARKALALASTRSASPWETRTRLVAELDAGLKDLLVNTPVFDRQGNLLGVADLLDPVTGLVIESDGAGHREAVVHSDDNIREERFERALMTVVRVTSVEHSDRFAIAARIRAAQRDARVQPNDRWTVEKPDWWWNWPPGRRWD